MPRVIDHDERRRQIIAVARQLMEEGGFAAATMRGIASAAGFANGALKHYFDGKDAIVLETFESVLTEMTEQTPPIREGVDPREELRSFLAATMPLNKHAIAGARVLLALWEHAQTNDVLLERYLKHMSMWKAELGKRLTAVLGEIPADDLQALIDETVTMSIGANVAALLMLEEQIIARYTRYVDDFMDRIEQLAPSPA